MRKKGLWKNLVSIVVGIMIIVCIMSFPIVYFRRVDATHYNTRHFMEKIAFALDTDVENVLMVGELHRILKSPYHVDISSEEIFLQVDSTSLTETTKYDFEVVTQIKDDGMLTLYCDKITNKVIEVKYQPKNYNQKKYIRKLCTEKGDKKLEQELESFLKYLGLDVIEDWGYQGVWDLYKSEANLYGKTKLDAYDYYIAGEEDEVKWCMHSSSAKLELNVTPQKDGIKYYFKVVNY